MNSIKEPQSRLRKWTTVDSMSVNTSLDQNSSKHGINYNLRLVWKQIWGGYEKRLPNSGVPAITDPHDTKTEPLPQLVL